MSEYRKELYNAIKDNMVMIKIDDWKELQQEITDLRAKLEAKQNDIIAIEKNTDYLANRCKELNAKLEAEQRESLEGYADYQSELQAAKRKVKMRGLLIDLKDRMLSKTYQERDEARKQEQLLQNRVDSLSSQLVDELSDRQKHLATIANLRGALEHCIAEIDDIEKAEDTGISDAVYAEMKQAIATLKEGE